MGMTDTDSPAPFLRIYYAVEDSMDCIPEDEPRLDAAVSDFVDSGGTRDSLVSLTRMTGGGFTVLASVVNSWFVVTAEQRRNGIVQTKAWDDLAKAVEAEMGMF